MKKYFLVSFIMIALFIVSCNANKSEKPSLDIDQSIDESSSIKDEQPVPNLTRKEKVCFTAFEDKSMIISQNENGEDYIAYGYNDATYIMTILYNDESKEELKALLEEKLQEIEKSVILDEFEDGLLIYFRNFNVYKKKQEELLNWLSSLEAVEKITVKNVYFSKRDTQTGFDFVSVEEKLDKDLLLKNYDDYKNLLTHLNAEQSEKITEEIFEDNIVIAVYRQLGGIYYNLDYDRYYNFQYDNGKIYLTYEHDSFGQPSSSEIWDVINLVIIPKTLIDDLEEISTDCEIIVVWRTVHNTNQIHDQYCEAFK